MTVTGATPLAMQESVPGDVSLRITGMVKKEYNLSSRVLNKFATARIRTREVTAGGEYDGAYVYTGIPLYNILEGVTPEKPKTAAFDRPLDMVVTLHSRSGKKAHFSYGELVMTDDRHPFTLAFHRRQVLPSKNPEKYTKNKYKDTVKGLRLICPRDPDTSRYLDDVTEMTLVLITDPGRQAPGNEERREMRVGGNNGHHGRQNRNPLRSPMSAGRKSSGWVRIGHGQGYKGISSAERLQPALVSEKEFQGCGPDNFFLFVACDGYRVLLSGREIFLSDDGASSMIARYLDGKEASGKYMLAPIDDYFVDRDVWGLTHVVMLEGPR